MTAAHEHKPEPPCDGPSTVPAAWAAYLAQSSRVSDASSLPHRFLVQIAHQAAIGDPDSCAIVATLLGTGRSIHRMIDRAMAQRGLSEARMATLLTLYALAPVPSNAADLAFHADVARSSMTRILDGLERRGWLVREPGHRNRRSAPVRLTEPGMQVTTDAVQHFLGLASSLAGHLTLHERQLTVTVSERLRRRAADLEKASVQTASA